MNRDTGPLKLLSVYHTKESDTWQSVKDIEHPMFETNTIGNAIGKHGF